MTSPGTSFADPGGGGGGDLSRDVQVNLNADVSGYTQQVGEAQQQTAAMAGSVDRLSASMSGLTKFAGKQLFRFAAADFAGLSAATASAASLEHQLGTLRATSVVTGTSMSAMKDQLDAAFSKFPVSRQAVIQLAETITSLGVTAPRAVGGSVDTFTKLGGATGESSIGLASGNLQLNRQMGNTDPGQVAGYANSLLTVSKMQGVASSGVLSFAQNIAPMARAAGIGEAAVLGISAAFQKAGADGAYAANTFNKVITEITTLSQTGSPELSKYASFVGKTTAEFKNMSATDQATKLFSEIGKGGPQALNFMSSIGLGPRDTKAVQAVAQSGDLKQAIAQAVGSAGNTANLDKGSEAAFSGLTDSIIEVGNHFVQLGEIIGGPLLAPLTLLVSAFGKVLNGVTTVVSALGPIVPAIALLAGGLATAAGLVMGKMGLIGLLALGRTALGPRSAGRVAMQEGRAAGAAMAGGMSQQAAMAASRSGQLVAAGGAQWRTSGPYAMGMAAGQRGPGMLSQAGTMLGGGVRGAGRFVMGTTAWALQDQARINRDSYTRGLRSGDPGFVRTTPTWRENVRTGGGGVGGVFAAGRSLIGTSIYAAGSMGAAATGGVTRAAARSAQRASDRLAPMAANLAAWPRPAPAPGAPVTPGPRPTFSPTAAMLNTTAAVGGVAAKTGGLLARGAGALGGAMFSPLGMIATMVAVPLIGSIVSSIKEGNAQKADISGSLNGTAKYDQALGKSSTGLARFGSSVDSAADRLAKFANTPIKDLSKVDSADINAVSTGDYKINDPNLRKVIEQATADQAKPGASPDIVKDAVGAYLSTMGGTLTGDKFTQVKRDVLSVMGSGQAGTVSQIMAASAASPGGVASTPRDYGNLASLAQTASNPQDIGDPANIETYKAIMGTASTGLQIGTQDTGAEGTKSRVAIALSMAAKSTSSADAGQNDRISQAQSFLAGLTGADMGQLSGGMGAASTDFGAGTEIKVGDTTRSSPFGNEKDALSVWVRNYANSDAGKAFLETNGMTEADLYNAAMNPAPLPGPSASETTTSLKKAGPLGQWAAGNAQFQAASTGAQSGQPVPAFRVAKQLSAEAVKEAGGNLPQAGANLMALADKIGGTTGALIRAAAQWTDYVQSLKLPTLTREEQLATTTQDAAAANAALTPDSSQESKDAAFAKTQAADTNKESYRQYMIGRIVQLKAFGVQQQRAQDAQDLQVNHSNRDFELQQSYAQDDYNLQRQYSIEDYGLQRVRSEQDYNLQVLRGQEDFQVSAQRSLADYQLNVNRQNADHARDLKRQAAAAAQDIYDPFIRIQTKAVTDAGTLIYNLREQNADIERQIQQIQELKDKGLSQDAIDTLKLSDAGNAQQVRALSMSLEQNPDMIGQINAQIEQRRAGTTALTQSSNNVNFRQGEEDFAQQMSRAAVDFGTQTQRSIDDNIKNMDRASVDFGTNTQRSADDNIKSMERVFDAFVLGQGRAVAAHQTALSDMALSFKITQDQAAQDLATSFTQYTGDFASVMAQLTAVTVSGVATSMPQISAIITAEITKAKQAAASQGAGGYYPGSNAGGANYQPSAMPNRAQGTQRAYAYGGISLTQQQALVSEQGPEAHIPLNSRGENFMAGLIARAMVQGVTAAVSGGPAADSTSVSSDNRISFAGADITVTASDPNAMARELAAKAKLSRLASPVRH